MAVRACSALLHGCITFTDTSLVAEGEGSGSIVNVCGGVEGILYQRAHANLGDRCGVCEPLASASGGACSAGGVAACIGPDALACVGGASADEASVRNPCGGCGSASLHSAGLPP